MNSPKVKTQKTLSALIAAALAFVTLFQAAATDSKATTGMYTSAEEAALVAEFDQFFEDAATEAALEEAILQEVIGSTDDEVKIFDANNQLIAQGNPEFDSALNKLVNQGDYLGEIGGQKYYRVAQ